MHLKAPATKTLKEHFVSCLELPQAHLVKCAFDVFNTPSNLSMDVWNFDPTNFPLIDRGSSTVMRLNVNFTVGLFDDCFSNSTRSFGILCVWKRNGTNQGDQQNQIWYKHWGSNLVKELYGMSEPISVNAGLMNMQTRLLPQLVHATRLGFYSLILPNTIPHFILFFGTNSIVL